MTKAQVTAHLREFSPVKPIPKALLRKIIKAKMVQLKERNL